MHFESEPTNIMILDRNTRMGVFGDEDHVAGHIRRYVETRNIEIVSTLVPNVSTLIVAVGGDGTMLTAMRRSLDVSGNVSVVGFNTGDLGFLVNPVPDYDHVTNILNSIFFPEDGHNPIKIENRTALSVSEMVGFTDLIAVNEVTIMNSENSPIVYDIKINDVLVSTQQGSGILVSTPTGSTAQALSAGGSIITPTSQVMQIVPLVPHSLASRPVIVDCSDCVLISARKKSAHGYLKLYIDGQFHKTSQGGEVVDINVVVAPNMIKQWSVPEHSFFSVLSDKLGWK